jgi:hypothetical protein
MSELETRKSSGVPPRRDTPQLSSPDAQTAEISPVTEYDDGIAEYEGGEVETTELGEVLEAGGADADLLAIPPRADDLGAALAARPPRVKLPRVTTSLVAAALICAGFIGGVLVQKHLGNSSSNRGAANFSFAGARGGAGATGGTGSGLGGFGGRGGTGGTGGAGAAGGSITGKVTVVSGDTLYVTASDGSVYTVKTTGSTTVNVSQAGSLSQLKPGQSVVISGSNDNNGNVTATSITANSASASPSPPSGN